MMAFGDQLDYHYLTALRFRSNSELVKFIILDVDNSSFTIIYMVATRRSWCNRGFRVLICSHVPIPS